MQKIGERTKSLIIAGLLVVLGGVVGYKLGSGQSVPFLSKYLGNTSQSAGSVAFQVKNTEQPAQYKDIDFQLFWKVWQTLEKSYVDPDKIKNDQMVYGAVAGMTASLGDPYTLFLPPVQEKRSEEDLGGAFFGVGIQLGFIDNVLSVSTPLKGSPAEAAGVKAKDLILHVTDKSKGLDKDTQGWTLQEAVDHIRGERGTEVTLTLLRRDEKPEPFKVTLKRDEIVIPSAELKYLDANGKKVAHIILSKFGDRTDGEFNTIIADIKSQSPKVSGIILDVRNNPGGYLDGAVSVVSEFIKSGLVVSQKGRYTSRDYTANGKARLAEYPMVVVVNGGSASAAEIVAGALRDQRGAKLIGEKTFGKGTVQDALRLDGGVGLHVTVAKWMMPKGDWIHETGIPVTVEVKNDPAKPEVDAVLEKAKEEVLK